MAISQGIWTVGTGGDYPNWYQFFYAIAAMTGNLTGRQISDVVEDYPWDRGVGNPIICSGFTLTLESNSPHNGVVGDGWISENTTASMHQLRFTDGHLVIKDLQFKSVSGNAIQLMNVGQVSGAVGSTLLFHDIIIDGNNVAQPFELLFSSVYNESLNTITVYNILHINAHTATSSVGCIRLDADANRSFNAWNIGIFNDGTGIGLFIADAAFGLLYSFKNIYIIMENSTTCIGVAGNGSETYIEDFTSSVATSDDTAAGGVGNQINILAEDIFESVDIMSEFFLVLKKDCSLSVAGQDVSTEADMKGLSFYDGIPPIGPFRAIEAPTPTPTPTEPGGNTSFSRKIIALPNLPKRLKRRLRFFTQIDGN